MNSRRNNARLLVVGILALSGAGAWISAQLVKQHASLWSGGDVEAGWFDRVCQATERAGFSCKGALASSWADVRLPIIVPSTDLSVHARTVLVPVAFMGMAYFILMGVWFALIGGPRPFGGPWFRLPFVFGLGGVGVSLFLVGVMALGLAPWCVWCVVAHAVNISMVIAIWRLNRRRPDPFEAESYVSASPVEAARRTLTSREVANVLAVSLIVVAGLWLYRRERLAMQECINNLRPYKSLVSSLQEDRDFLMREHLAQPRDEIPRRSGEASAENRPQLIVFTDFECPSCRCKSQSLKKQVIGPFEGRIDVIVRHYPLCNACNEHVKRLGHQNACDAAYAAEAARILGGTEAFWKMHDLLFGSGDELGKIPYRELADRIGLDVDHFVREMRGETVRRIVESDIALANTLGVTGTPTLFLDGRRVTRLCQTPRFWEAVADHWGGSSQPAPVESIASRAIDSTEE
ncbi:MAG: thioredoxin domain-containing protein [Planctomycetota bacterium]|nr:thioredoxin domain-containing protein [Planctomycetota bacterium]